MSQEKPYDNLLSYLDEFYPNESETQSLTFSNYPHLQKIADLMTDLLNDAEHRKLTKEETQLIIRACSTLINENNDISVSDIQTNRVVKRKGLAYDSEFDDPEVMREKIIDLHQQIAVYSAEMKNHQNQVDSLRNEKSELKDENENLQRKFNELKRTREDEVSKLTVQKEGINDQYKTTKLDLELEADKGLNLSAQIDSMMKETNEKDEDIEKLQQKNKEQKDLLRKAKSLLKVLESRIIEDKSKINRLNNQIKTLKSQSPSKRKMEKDNLSLQEENNFLRDRMVKLTDTNERNIQTITELLNENQRISQEIMTLTSQRENDEQENAQNSNNTNRDNQNNNPVQTRSPQRNSSPKQSNNLQSKSPTNGKNNFNLSDFEENSTSTFNDVFESANAQQAKNESEYSASVIDNKSNGNKNSNKPKNRSENADRNADANNNESQEMRDSLRKIANLFKKSNIRPSQLPSLSQRLQNQDQLLTKFRSTIDAQARFITRLINEDYVAPHLLTKTESKEDTENEQNEEECDNEESINENNNKNDKENKDENKEYPTSSVFTDQKLKEFVLRSVEDTRQVAYETLKDNKNTEFNEIVLYDSIFDPEEGADLLIAEQESRGADNELAALAILLSIIIKQRKIGESDAKFLQSIYKNMALDFDHPATAEDATSYIDDIHSSIKKLRKFYNSELERFDPQKDNAEFLVALTNGIAELAPAIKESAGFKGKLIDLPDYLTSSANRNAQNRSASLNESGSLKNNNKQRSNEANQSNDNNEEDFDEAVDLKSFSSPEESEDNNEEDNEKNQSNPQKVVKSRGLNPKNDRNTQNIENGEEDDDSIFGERINSVSGSNASETKVRKLRDEINRYKNEIKKLTQQLDEANTTSEILQEAFERVHRKSEETEKNAHVIILERDRLQDLLEEREKQFDQRIKKVTNHMQDQKDREIKVVTKRYEEENKILSQKVDSRDKRMREIKKNMKEIIGMYEDLLMRQRQEMRELSKKNEEVESEAKKYIKDDSENIRKIAELQDKIADLVMQRSNELSLTVTSANNSLSLDNTNIDQQPRTPVRSANNNNNDSYFRNSSSTTGYKRNNNTSSINRNNTTNNTSSINRNNTTNNSSTINRNQTSSSYAPNNNYNNSYNNNYARNNNFSPTNVHNNFSPTNVHNNFNANNNRNNNNNNLNLNNSSRNNNSGTSF